MQLQSMRSGDSDVLLPYTINGTVNFGEYEMPFNKFMHDDIAIYSYSTSQQFFEHRAPSSGLHLNE